MSSIEPNDGGGEVNGGEEVAGGLVVAGGDGAELLELGEEILDQVARLVEVSVVVRGELRLALGGITTVLPAAVSGSMTRFLGIERLVGDQRVGLHRGQQLIGTDEIVRLAAGQGEADRIAERIDQRVDLGAQSAARAADRLVLAGFFWAPALC